MDSIPAAGTTPVTIHFSAAGILRRIIQGILGIPIPRLDPRIPGRVYGLIIVIITAVPLYDCIASMSMSIQDRLFGWFIVSAQTQPLIQAFEPFIHDRMTASCTKTYQRAGRRRQNGLIFYCCCSHTTYTTTDTGFNFHTGSHFSRTRRISALRCGVVSCQNFVE